MRNIKWVLSRLPLARKRGYNVLVAWVGERVTVEVVLLNEPTWRYVPTPPSFAKILETEERVVFTRERGTAHDSEIREVLRAWLGDLILSRDPDLLDQGTKFFVPTVGENR